MKECLTTAITCIIWMSFRTEKCKIWNKKFIGLNNRTELRAENVSWFHIRSMEIIWSEKENEKHWKN